MAASLALRAAAELELRRRQEENDNYTVVGFVDPEKGFTHALSNQSGQWQASQEEPQCYLPAKLEKVLISDKRFVVVIGGRGSGKSLGIGDICAIDAKDNGAKTYCLREFQSSIKNSVHSLIKDEIKRLEFEGFETQATTIQYNGNDVFQFLGIARNTDSIKSAHGFKRFWVEEAQFISEDSLTALTPTARNKPNKGLPKQFKDEPEQEEDNLKNVQMVFVANPQSSEDPFSKRFIVPYEDALERDGFYEDDMHLIVMMNYTDNPWYEESGLEQERVWTYKNTHRAYYDHVWHGKYNDSVENSLILAEWFDACIDAHIKLGFEGNGARIAAHDASDEGGDSKGYAARHGSVVFDVQEREDLNVNEGGHWACGVANTQKIDYFTWDADGMGAALGEQISVDFKDKATRLVAFKGSESPDNPESIYKPALESPVANQIKIKDALRNKRAQYYAELRDRCYRTYRAVIHKEYHNPDDLISFSSDIKLLSKLRAELTRMPTKPNGNGLLELYTKQEMKNKFKFKSPNLGDSVMMLMRYIPLNVQKPRIPKPLKSMGRR